MIMSNTNKEVIAYVKENLCKTLKHKSGISGKYKVIGIYMNTEYRVLLSKIDTYPIYKSTSTEKILVLTNIDIHKPTITTSITSILNILEEVV